MLETQLEFDSVVDEAMINLFDYERSELINMYSGVVASLLCQEDFMKAYKCGKEAQHHFTARCISDSKELHRPLKKMNLHSFKTAVKPKKDKKGKYLSNRKLFTHHIDKTR